MSAIIGPIPPYSNVPISPQYYNPSQFYISAISLGVTTTITTTVNLNYVIGQLVRLLIPSGSGCTQLNQQLGYVISIPNPNQVQITINSSQNVDPFTSSTARTQPQIVAVGDVNNGVVNTNGLSNQITSIPGSFINVSPPV